MTAVTGRLALGLLLAVSGFSQSPFRVTSSLQNFQVIQRQGNSATLAVSGQSDTPGSILVSITSHGRPLPNWIAAQAGSARAGSWSAQLKDVPTGGPYRILFQLRDSAGTLRGETSVDSIHVGDIWVLAGQSNMVGRARLDAPEPPDERVHMQLPEGGWALAREPLHERKDGPDGEAIGAGSGLTFAKEMVRRTGVPIGLIPCAKGGTNLTQWDPAKKNLGRESLYGALIERVKEAGGTVAGVLWYQGEADSRATRAALYAERFRHLVASLRADLQAPSLPFYYAQLARFAGEELSGHTVESEEIVRETQRKAEAEIPNSVLVATIDLELTDHIHLDAASQRRMGHRFAAVVCSQRFPTLASCPATQRGPRLALLSWDSPYLLRVRFSDVNGQIRSTGRVLGFSVADETGKPRQLIFRAELQGSDVLLWFNRLYAFPARMSLWYGRGFDPACNLTDQADLAVPAFGPVALPPRPQGPGDKVARQPLPTPTLHSTLHPVRQVDPSGLPNSNQDPTLTK